MRYSNPIVKYAYQNNEAMENVEPAVIKKIPNIIKRQVIDYSFEQKYELGIMTEYEYMLWQEELAKKAEDDRQMAENVAISEEEAAALSAIIDNDEKVDMSKKTFWEGEEGDRENLSDDVYEKFLEQNMIDVSNKTTASFEELAAQAAAEEAFKQMEIEDEVARIQDQHTPTQGSVDSLFEQVENIDNMEPEGFEDTEQID